MLGLGETGSEIILETMDDARAIGVEVFTIGPIPSANSPTFIGKGIHHS